MDQSIPYAQKEITVSSGKGILRGDLFLPEAGKKKYPAVICSHILGADRRMMHKYGRLLASMGAAACCFDFAGCGQSDGDPLKMSLLSEAEDLGAVLAAAGEWEFADPERIVLLGESQGAAASALTAAAHGDIVRGLILCFPAFIIHDAVRELYETREEVPESFFFRWLTVGRAYVTDVWDYDVYEEIGRYKKPVLLMHGSEDDLVPKRYSDRAAETYPDVRYKVIQGAGHRFAGEAFAEAASHISAYLKEIHVL